MIAIIEMIDRKRKRIYRRERRSLRWYWINKKFKVKGDLILISADVDHSLSKVLPLQQSLIPVCFKRKLSYQGSYIEEFVEKTRSKCTLLG